MVQAASRKPRLCNSPSRSRAASPTLSAPCLASASTTGCGRDRISWRQSLKKLDFLVDVDIFMTDTAKLADLVLPACTSFERSELKFYPQQYVIWTKPVIRPLWESRSDAEIIFDLARRMVPDDALMQKGYEACIDWMLEPTKLTLDELKKYPAGYAVKNVKAPPFQKYKKNGFATPSGKMEFTSTILAETGYDPLPVYKEPKLSPRSTPEVAKEFPLILTTGARLPMFVHSRTFRLDWTRSLRPDPMVDINPQDAQERGIAQDDWVSLSTPRELHEGKGKSHGDGPSRCGQHVP